MAQYGAEQPLVRDFSHPRDTRKVADRFGGARFEAGHKILGGLKESCGPRKNPDSYAGVHNFAGVMLVFDESSGIPDSIWSVAAGFFTEDTPNRFWLAFSNPRRNSGYFYECFNSKRDFWDTDTIDARSVEGTDVEFYKSIIDEYGPESYQANVEVYGAFPDSGEDLFISPSLVEGAMGRALEMTHWLQ